MTLNMFKAHTADDMRSILDGSRSVSIVWVLALGNQIANGYSIGDRIDDYLLFSAAIPTKIDGSPSQLLHPS